MTAGQRLVFLSGLASASAGQHLYAIRVSGTTSGQILVSRSGLGTATAADHLLYDAPPPAQVSVPAGGFIVNMGRMMGR